MTIKNSTSLHVSTALQEAVLEYPTDGLIVELKYCPRGSRRYISGTYYRTARNYANGRLIRLRINRGNRYPVEIQFKTSQYYKRRDARGDEMVYQRLKKIQFHTPEDLILAIFLHEFSHYLDHMEGRNGRYKQTKADKFALAVLRKLDVI
jgi:hypothetical protein